MDWRETLSGAYGACCLVAAGAPLDALKTRVQTGRADGILSGFRALVREFGVFALWRGSSAAWTSAVVENSVVFSANGVFRRVFADGRDEAALSVREHVACGALAGIFSSLAIIIPEVLKVRQQSFPEISNPLKLARHIVRVDGVQGLFSGVSALLARDLPFNAIFFGAYSLYNRALLHHFPSTSPDSSLVHLLAGGTAGASAWVVVFPMDVIKSRLALNPTANPLQELKSAIASKTLFRGAQAAIARAFIGNGALFVGYEQASRFLGATRHA